MKRRIERFLFDYWHPLTNGLRNLWRWVPIIWRDRDFDWEFLGRIMEAKLRWMAEATKHCLTARSDRHQKQMLVCADLLKRLMEDDYYDNAIKRCGKPRIAFDIANAQNEADKRYLGLILGKYLNHWWD